MRNAVWKRILWISIAVLLCVGIGGYFAMDAAVNFALKQLASGVDLEQAKEEQQLAVNEPIENKAEPEAESGSSDKEASAQPIQKPKNDNPPNKEQKEKEKQKESKQPAEAPQEKGSATEEKVAKEPEPEPKRADVSEDYVEQIQQQVSAGEKVKVVSTLLKHFSMAELQQFAEIASDGITVEEKKAARDDFLNRLSEEEYNTLIAIAAKYGLSQGRTYKEVKKEGSEE